MFEFFTFLVVFSGFFRSFICVMSSSFLRPSIVASSFFNICFTKYKLQFPPKVSHECMYSTDL